MTYKRIIATSVALAFAGTAMAHAQTTPGYGMGNMQGFGMGNMQGYQQGYGAGQSGPMWGTGPMFGQQMPFGGMNFGWNSGPTQNWGMMQGYRDPNAPGRGRFSMVDADQNGVITEEEASSQADMVFSAMDNDDDGMLTLNEYMTIRMGPQDGFNPSNQTLMQKRKEARFDPMDADSDGSVSKDEFMTAAQTHFADADDDGDGKVSPWDYRRQNWN